MYLNCHLLYISTSMVADVCKCVNYKDALKCGAQAAKNELKEITILVDGFGNSNW